MSQFSSNQYNWNDSYSSMPYGTPAQTYYQPNYFYNNYAVDYNNSMNSSGYMSASISDSPSQNTSKGYETSFSYQQFLTPTSLNLSNFQQTEDGQDLIGQRASKRVRLTETTQRPSGSQIVDSIFQCPAEYPTKRTVKRKISKKCETNQVEDQIKNEIKDESFEWDKENINSSNFEGFNDSDLNLDGKKKRVLTKSQREAANQRERKRMNIMNQSFVNLRAVLPISTGRKRRKMSRLDIVCGAIEYIAYLEELLNSNNFPCEIDFDAYQRNLYFQD